MLEKATALHLANRLGFGPAPGDLNRIEDASLEDFLDRQFHPETARLAGGVRSVLDALPSFGRDCPALFDTYWAAAQTPDLKALPDAERKQLKARERQVEREAQIARLARAIASPWQLHEALVEFWFNHFNIYSGKGVDRIWVGAYEEQAIRPNTLGRFSDLLLATARHPAMLIYLDNAKNVSPVAQPLETAMPGDSDSAAPRRKQKDTGINENYAREVMELHTLGVDGGYTQADVVSLAHILTGWTVGPGAESDAAATARLYQPSRGAFRFAVRRHDSSPETLLGQTFSGDSVGEGESALLMLARHPSTARHISFKLAQYFVSDEPPQGLVEAMAASFRRTDGDIRSVLATMFTSEEFLAPSGFGTKYKTPYRYVVSAARAADAPPSNAAMFIGVLADLGQPLYGCVTPDGYACTERAWLDSGSLLRRLAFAMRVGAGVYNAAPGAAPVPLDAARLADMLAPGIGENTRAAIKQVPETRRAAAILGSPEFMRC